MATDLDIGPVEKNVRVTRGDSKTFGFNMFLADGITTRPIAGFAYTMTVSTKKKPLAGDPIVFSVAGAVSSPSVTFSPSIVQTDQTPKKYYFDVEETNGAGETYTVIKGEFLIEQDITK